jgi:hypothetical protein
VQVRAVLGEADERGGDGLLARFEDAARFLESNWAGNITYSAKAVHEPQSVAEVQDMWAP